MKQKSLSMLQKLGFDVGTGVVDGELVLGLHGSQSGAGAGSGHGGGTGQPMEGVVTGEASGDVVEEEEEVSGDIDDDEEVAGGMQTQS